MDTTRTSSSWAGRLANLTGRGIPDTDPRIVECRRELAIRRLQRAVAAESGTLDADAIRAALLDPAEEV
ncbi:MAG: hypothetical protein WBD41_01100, partial [Rhodococcus sp. (in: high G+C Gram-positive bacteria)]